MSIMAERAYYAHSEHTGVRPLTIPPKMKLISDSKNPNRFTRFSCKAGIELERPTARKAAPVRRDRAIIQPEMSLILFGLWAYVAFFAVSGIVILIAKAVRFAFGARTPVRVRPARQEPTFSPPMMPQAPEPLNERESIFQAPLAPSRPSAAVVPERAQLTEREIELRRAAFLQATART
jgi:hypothetical protein